MIDPRELRYGNLLQTHRMEQGEIIEVNTLSTHPDHEEILLATNYFPNLILSQCEPIPLTQEWLVKLGFEFDDETKRWSLLTSLELVDWLLELEHVTHTVYVTLGNIEWDFEYIHQLQNFYFALTEKELEYENSKTQTDTKQD